MWNTFRVAYLTGGEEGNRLCQLTENKAKEIFPKCDLNSSVLISMYEKYKSLEKLTEYNIELNAGKILENNGAGRIYIYGCGSISTYISLICEKYNIKIQGYITTSASQDQSDFFGKNVCSLSEYEERQNDMVVLAMSYDKQDEVEKSLENKEGIRIIKIECWQ